uniref:SANTA domain-containing protein n=1 Tax=Strongyloides stercoralis TaxID=6248 RepID=A0A0K0E930_STRER
MALQPYYGRKLFLTRWIIKFIPSDEDSLDFNVKLTGLMTPTPVGPIEDTFEFPRRRKRKYYTFTPYTTDFLETVHGAKLLQFENKETIVLVDGMSYEEGLKAGYPASFIDYFRFGFPPTWEFIISKFYLSRQRCILGTEAPRAIKGILKNNLEISGEPSNQKKQKSRDVNDKVTVSDEQNKENKKSRSVSTSKNVSSSKKEKDLSKKETSQNSEKFNMSLRSQSVKSQSQTTHLHEIPQKTRGTNNKSREVSSQKITRQEKSSLPIKKNEDQQKKGRSQSLKTFEVEKTTLHVNDERQKIQRERSQSQKTPRQTEKHSSSGTKTNEQPLKSCLRKRLPSSFQKENFESKKLSSSSQQHTLRKDKLLEEKIPLIDKQSFGSKRFLRHYDDSPKTKNPRQSISNEYNFTFLPNKNFGSKKPELVLPRCI